MLSPLLGVLDAAEHVYVAVRTRSGPHVTPELFTVDGGRVLCLTSVATLKAKLLRRDPTVGMTVCAGAVAGVAVAEAAIIDPASPGTMLRSPLRTAATPRGVARFVRDNASELAGAAVDLVAGRLGGPIPPHRVVLAMTPTAVAVVDGDALTSAAGWDEAPAPLLDDDADGGDDTGPSIDLADVPEHLAALAVSGDAVVGWNRGDGAPLALPVMWDADACTARLPTALFETCAGAPASPACVTFDTWTGFGPSGKRGLMLRGEGRASAEGSTTCLHLEVTRATYWDGIETSTTDVA